MDTALKLEALLEHADWVRRLAHSLVADPARADDVAQETWLAALQAPPRESNNLRAWLGTVVRNAARRSVRSQGRRDAREASAARNEALPSAAELVEQADLQREIAAMVIALDEPYRQMLLLRYYQGLSAEEIATRSNVPPNTVRTRLQRGLGQLRERLDRRHGDRGAWCALLAPMLRAPLATQALIQGSLLSSMGVLIMSAKMKWLAVAVAGLLALWLYWPRELVTRDARALISAASTPEQPLAELSDLAAAPRDSERLALPLAPPAVALAEAPPRVTTVVHGRCVDLSGVPMAGLELEWIDQLEARVVGNVLAVGMRQLELTPQMRLELADEAKAAKAYPEVLRGARGVAEAVRGEKYRRPKVLTEIDGTFRIEQEGGGGRLVLTRKDLCILDQVHVAEFAEALYLVAPCIDIAGIVVDKERRPVANAHVGWTFRAQAATTFPFVVADSGQSTAATGVDELGRFAINQLPLAAGCTLSANARGFQECVVKIPDHPIGDMVIVMDTAAPERDRHVAGRVVHRDGRAAASAEVYLGQDAARCGIDGRFRLELTADVAEDAALAAYSKDARPAVLADFGAKLRANDSVMDDFQIVLDAPLPPIRGRVLDASDKPCANWRVVLLDARQLGTSNQSVESVAGDDRTNQVTDAQGGFRFGGLLDHPYRVRACNTDTMLAVESAAAVPGTDDLIVRVPAEATIERVFGRVISRRGMAVGGASISLGLVVVELGGSMEMVWREAAKTDAQGLFELHGLPRSGCRIGATDDRIRSNAIEFEASMAGRELLIEVDLDLRFRVEARRPGEFDAFQLQGRDSKPLPLVMHMSNSESTIERVRAGSEGQFPVCSTNESAETLVLYLGDKEIRRVPLTLRPGEITIVRP